MLRMTSEEEMVELYWRYVAESGSTDRNTRLSARDRTSGLAANFESTSDRIRRGGPEAAETVVLLAAAARSTEQVGFLAAGPCEDLWEADSNSFLDVVLPAIPRDLAQKLVDGMSLSPQDEARIRKALR